MVDFESALRSSLEKANEKFQTADKDLHDVVVAVSEALAKVTDGKCRVYLHRSGENRNAVYYGLILQDREAQQAEQLFQFVVPVSGYPIEISKPHKVNNRQELETFFAELMANTDSALVTTVAYFRRRAAG